MELPKRISYGPVDKMTVGLLRRIHRVSLPVRYSKNIYDVISQGINAKGILAYFNDDVPVGEICYRIEKDEETKKEKIYIMTIGVLPPYQHMGIARGLVDKVMSDNSNIDTIYLHVHTENEGAMTFYSKIGFTKKELVKDYYKKLEKKDAYIFEKIYN